MSYDENLPASAQQKPRVVEAEVVDGVGAGPRPPWWKRLLARAAVSLSLAVLGVIACLLGVVLTVTVVGAAIGVPLILVGAILLLVALINAFGGGKIHVTRFPPRD